MINMKKDFLSILDINKDQMLEILKLAEKIKRHPSKYFNALYRKTLVMIFEKASTRTRLSFEIAMTQLGGHAIFFSKDSHFYATGEDVFDTAKIISGYSDFLTARVNSHDTLEQFAKYCDIPVLNALSDLEHPLQALADMMTMKELKGFDGLKVAYVGDGYNVCNSLMLACGMLGVQISMACPKGYEPKMKLLAPNMKPFVSLNESPTQAVKDADVVYTDTWISLVLESEKENRIKTFSPYQVNETLMKKAKKDAIFMHCLPAHKGMEVTKEVIEGPQSVIFQQANNRLHTAKALLLFLDKNGKGFSERKS